MYVDGHWSAWVEWSRCSKSCGKGRQDRLRQCDNPTPRFGGKKCQGNTTQSRSCRSNACPVDGNWGAWTVWSTCSTPCGIGTQNRTRNCDSPRPEFNGKRCKGTKNQHETCIIKSCPVDGNWGVWMSWSRCSKSCGRGKQYRRRACDDPIPKFGGKNCQGNATQSQSCLSNTCPVDGSWGSWNKWSKCSKSCGIGSQSRARKCDSPMPEFGGQECVGPGSQYEHCSFQSCPVDGKWSAWTSWSRCSKSCGGGKQDRSRKCDHPAPTVGGKECQGNATQSQSCRSNPCAVDGNWGAWGSWGACTKSCGGGMQSKKRECNNPVPKFNGNPCLGLSTSYQRCNSNPCPVDGNWGEWNSWSVCSKSCGTGSRDRIRQCNNPIPMFKGKECEGDKKQNRDCNSHPCPVNGNWGTWTKWSNCSKSCGVGKKSRFRECDSPKPQFYGEECKGVPKQHENCNFQACPVDGQWSAWAGWSSCSKSCGKGRQDRIRLCDDPTPRFGGKKCQGSATQSRSCRSNACPVNGNWGTWSKWSNCSKSCGVGMQSRNRKCDSPKPQFGGMRCTGADREHENCNYQSCPVDGKWNSWTTWSTCSQSCGTGRQERLRECKVPSPMFGGKECQGNATQSRNCNSNSCPVDGNWGTWSKWSTCSKSCAVGKKRRTRKCDSPKPQFHGKECSGAAMEHENCNFQRCPVDGKWSAWTSWSLCSKSCGTGRQDRRRKCDNPTPAFGGRECQGNTTQSKSCSSKACPVHGNWGSWSQWGICAKSCGEGIQTRNRSCDNPRPAYEGEGCKGVSYQPKKCNLKPCSVDGGWSSWQVWSTCSFSCASGTRFRQRTCSNPRPHSGGQYCKAGKAKEMRSCNTVPCNVNGAWSPWTAWTSCSKNCSGGRKRRSHECQYPFPNGYGKDCQGFQNESMICNAFECQVNGGWSKWEAWTSCTESCGTGLRFRKRQCSSPKPSGTGKDCQGHWEETGHCSVHKCNVDGNWSPWTRWTSCSKSCEGGKQGRSRQCNSPTPIGAGKTCDGEEEQSRKCKESFCPVIGGWSPWGLIGQCNADCGFAFQPKQRLCSNPEVVGTAKYCQGDWLILDMCKIKRCRAPSKWSMWTLWTDCSKSCTSGNQRRSRKCLHNYTYQNISNLECRGNKEEERSCSEHVCPVHGKWSEWSQWTICTETCGGGKRRRLRSCTSPAPSVTGNKCPGDAENVETCNSFACSVGSILTEWSNWRPCTKTCQGGIKLREQFCSYLNTTHRLEKCNGRLEQTQNCNLLTCSVDGNWGHWNPWTECTVSCGGGKRTRTRSCNNPAPQGKGKYCSGQFVEGEKCSQVLCTVHGAWSLWSDWSSCGVTCGNGFHWRSRTCSSPTPVGNGYFCSGLRMERQLCSRIRCGVNSHWSQWTFWSVCSSSCNGGHRQRNRTCISSLPSAFSMPCPGSGIENITCNVNVCPITLGWNRWQSWSGCTRTCGKGLRHSLRVCTVPTPYAEKYFCLGSRTRSAICEELACAEAHSALATVIEVNSRQRGAFTFISKEVIIVLQMGVIIVTIWNMIYTFVWHKRKSAKNVEDEEGDFEAKYTVHPEVLELLDRSGNRIPFQKRFFLSFDLIDQYVQGKHVCMPWQSLPVSLRVRFTSGGSQPRATCADVQPRPRYKLEKQVSQKLQSSNKFRKQKQNQSLQNREFTGSSKLKDLDGKGVVLQSKKPNDFAEEVSVWLLGFGSTEVDQARTKDSGKNSLQSDFQYQRSHLTRRRFGDTGKEAMKLQNKRESSGVVQSYGKEKRESTASANFPLKKVDETTAMI